MAPSQGLTIMFMYLVPKLLLGNGYLAQALLGHHIVISGNIVLIGFAKQSFAPKWVPKLELGNQKTRNAADNPVKPSSYFTTLKNFADH